MESPTEPGDLDALQLLRSVDPAPSVDDETLNRVWETVTAALDSTPRPRRRPRRGAVVLASIAAVAALSAAVPFLATRTGELNPPETVGIGGPGEFYRLDGTDLGAQLRALSADIPYPDETSRVVVISGMVADARRSPGLVATTGARRAELARGALCTWGRSWVAARSSGDVDETSRAASALRGAVAWPAVTDVDPAPWIHRTPGQGVTDFSVFGYLVAINQAVEVKRTAEVSRLLSQESAYCLMLETTRPETAAVAAPSPPPEDASPQPTSPATTSRP